jgi:cyanophycinase-like exopeptidase
MHHTSSAPRIRDLSRLAVICVTSLACFGAWAGSDKVSGGGKNVSPKTTYSYYTTGDQAVTPTISLPPSSPSTVLMGGGTDVDEAFRWMIKRAGIQPGGGGRVVIIRASGADGYNCYIFSSSPLDCTSAGTPQQGAVGGASLGVSSVETLVIPSVAAANDTTVNNIVAKANVIWIAGGDQADYYTFWRGTVLADTLSQARTRYVPIGGTSAGMMILPGFDFAALRGSVTSSQAMSDPYNKYMTIQPDPQSYNGFMVSPGLETAIVDAHVDERDRMGRLITLMARLIKSNGISGCTGGLLSASTGAIDMARAIGLSIQTALLIEGPPGRQSAQLVANPANSGTAGARAAYLVEPTVPPQTCASSKPLTMQGVTVHKVTRTQPFDFSNWGSLAPINVQIENGQLKNFTY